MNNGYEPHEDGNSSRSAEHDMERDEELLATIQAAISNRRTAPARDHLASTDHPGANTQVGTTGETLSIAAFSSELAGTMPSIDARFHDDLLARLMKELAEPVEEEWIHQASAPLPQLPPPGAAASQKPQRSETGLPAFRIPRSTLRIPRSGWAASAATALAGLAVVLLVIGGMTGMFKLRWDPNQPNKNILAVPGSASASATPQAPATTLGGAPTISPFSSSIASSACGTWSIVDSPNVDVGNVLQAIAASAPDDAWAVGSSSGSHVNDAQGWQPVHPDRTLILHWGGKSWAEVPAPDVGAGDNAINSLRGVAVASGTEAWAVGYYNNGQVKSNDGTWHAAGPDHSLILRWDGKTWNIVPIPDIEGTDNRLEAVVAISGNDVWAVGSYGGSYAWSDPNAPIAKTLIFHWDGKTWTRVPAPNPGKYGNRLLSVAATASDDVWAAGTLNQSESKAIGGVDTDPLILHWDGHEWSQSPAPTGLNIVTGVAAASRDAAWVIGSESSECCNDARMLRWDGTRWTTEPIPSTKLPGDAQPGSLLTAIAAIAPNDVWAVGNYTNDSEVNTFDKNKTLAMHWDGIRWTILPSPNRQTVGSNENIPSFKQQVSQITGLAAISSYNLWAVGYSAIIDDRTQTFAMHYAGSGCATTQPLTTAAVSHTWSPVVYVESTQITPTSTLTPSSASTAALHQAAKCGLTWSPVPLTSSNATDEPDHGPFTGMGFRLNTRNR